MSLKKQQFFLLFSQFLIIICDKKQRNPLLRNSYYSSSAGLKKRSSRQASSSLTSEVFSIPPLLPKFYYCEVCFRTTSETDSQTTGTCKHRICVTCACPYFNSALKDIRYSSITSIECPAYGCKDAFTVTESFLAKFFNKNEIDAWWSAALQKSFIKNKVIIIYGPLHYYAAA